MKLALFLNAWKSSAQKIKNRIELSKQEEKSKFFAQKNSWKHYEKWNTTKFLGCQFTLFESFFLPWIMGYEVISFPFGQFQMTCQRRQKTIKTGTVPKCSTFYLSFPQVLPHSNTNRLNVGWVWVSSNVFGGFFFDFMLSLYLGFSSNLNCRKTVYLKWMSVFSYNFSWETIMGHPF